MKVYIGSDHAGFKLKEEIKKALSENNISYTDLGHRGCYLIFVCA